MSYYHAKKTAEAKRYLDSRERDQAIKIADERKLRSVAWLEKFRASGRASRTSFDWRPRWPRNTGATNAEENSEAGNVMAHADAPGEGRREGGQAERGGGAAREGSESAQATPAGEEAEYDTPF